MNAYIFRVELYGVDSERGMAQLNTFLEAHNDVVIKTTELIANDVLFVVVYVAGEGRDK